VLLTTGAGVCVLVSVCEIVAVQVQGAAWAVRVVLCCFMRPGLSTCVPSTIRQVFSQLAIFRACCQWCRTALAQAAAEFCSKCWSCVPSRGKGGRLPSLPITERKLQPAYGIACCCWRHRYVVLMLLLKTAGVC